MLGNIVRPIEADSLSTEARDIVYKRDGGSCCATREPFKSLFDSDAKFVHIAPPVSEGPELSEGVSLPTGNCTNSKTTSV